MRTMQKELNTTELRFWERRLEAAGGSLSFEKVLGGFATQTERIVMVWCTLNLGPKP